MTSNILKTKLPAFELKSVYTAAGVVIAVVLMSVGFKFLYYPNIPDYMKDMIGGCIGALLTIAATAALIQSQANNELRREQSVEVFKVKLATYTAFLAFLHRIIEDGVIDESEKSQLVDWGLKLSLVAGDGVIWTLCQFLEQTLHVKNLHYDKLTDDEELKWKECHKKLHASDPQEVDCDCRKAFVSVGFLIQELRRDLGETQIVNNDRRTPMINYIDRLAVSRSSASSHRTVRTDSVTAMM